MNPPGTAVERPDGSRESWSRGKLHRLDGPALEHVGHLRIWVPYNQVDLSGPVELWFRRGHLHRDDGPAIEDDQGSTLWFRDGKLHRDDGPAIDDLAAEVRLWFQDGEPHRENAPAVELYGVQMEWDELLLSGPAEIWFRHGKLHREGGPAITDALGNEQWYQDGSLHREGGPAILNDEGQPADLSVRAAWYEHGKLVRVEDWPDDE